MLSSAGGPNVSHAPSAMVITILATSCPVNLGITAAVYTHFVARSCRRYPRQCPRMATYQPARRAHSLRKPSTIGCGWAYDEDSWG